MPEPGCSARWSASQASRCCGVFSWTTPSRSDSRSRVPRWTRTCESVGAVGVHAQLLGDVVGHPGVGGRGGREHRDPRRQLGEQRAEAAVVGAEVVAPVGDAVGLVDHQQAAGRGEPGQHLVAEARVVEPLRADQQDVDLAGLDLVVDRLPLVDVGGVDRDRADAGPLRRRDLVAHQREQRADDHGRSRARLAQQLGRDEVDRRLAPPGALHDQRPAGVDGERLDGGPLVLAQHGVVPSDERREVALGRLARGASYVVRDGGGGCHGPCLPTATDARAPGRGPAWTARGPAQRAAVLHEAVDVDARPAGRPRRLRRGQVGGDEDLRLDRAVGVGVLLLEGRLARRRSRRSRPSPGR